MDKYEAFLNKIGNRVKELRKSKNISQEKLAFGIDVDLSFIGRIEKAQRVPSLKTIYLLAKFFGMEISEFLDFRE